MRQWIHDFTTFFFPLYCPVCGTPLYVPGQVICLTCEQKMPRTNYTSDPENPVAQIFWGRVRLEGATSLFRFEKGSAYQSLLHLLKYKGGKNVGHFLGRMLGAEVAGTPFVTAEVLVPVPLHKTRQKARGYNQSELIAAGVSAVTGIPVNTRILQRRTDTDSQTRKSRFERWENMESVFSAGVQAAAFANHTFLLIDDVVTTGSTLESCATILAAIPGSSVYIATIACA
jgi:ComF family protein